MTKLNNLPIKGHLYSFEQYLDFVEQLIKDNQHSGQTEDELLKKFTVNNRERLRRIYDQFTITSAETEALSKIGIQNWILIGESWCGDVSSSLPVIAKIAATVPKKVTLRLILRDQNPEVMDMYLSPTGGRSIPKLIFFNEAGVEFNTWGSRPQGLASKAAEWKSENLPFMDVVKRVYAWYDIDENLHEISREVIELAAKA